MEAGRELDALIAEKVMGWRIFEKYADWIGIPIGREPYPALVWNYSNPPGWLLWSQDKKDAKIWSPSTDIAAAWQVVERLAVGMIQFRYENTGTGTVYAKFVDCAHNHLTWGDASTSVSHAICLAALQMLNISTN